MLIYTQDNPNGEKYRSLDREGLIIQVIFGDTGEDIYLEGVSVSATVPELFVLIQKQCGVHPSRQRLYVGGEEMPVTSGLLDYYATSSLAQARGGCTLTLRCFVPLLISSLHCPGPMLTEVEVRPRNDEPVVNVKRRIRDKFRIEVSRQRLHLHPAEMTSFVFRRPLDDARLLSTYLSPERDGNFLELIVFGADCDESATRREIFVRIPRKVTNARGEENAQNLHFSPTLHCQITVETAAEESGENPGDGGRLPPPPPPQTPESDNYKGGRASETATPLIEPAFPAAENSNTEVWWLTCPVRIDEVIKRDPSAEDIRKVFIKMVKQQPALKNGFVELENDILEDGQIESEKNFENLKLKYCLVKPVGGGKAFESRDSIYADLQMRFEENLVSVAYGGLEEKQNAVPSWYKQKQAVPAPTIQPVKPLMPLADYNDPRVRFSAPRDPVSLSWGIDPVGPVDCGAKPGAVLELTGASFARCYGSWDIPEHRKTYVEITAEGSFMVGDSGLSALIEFDENSGKDQLDFDADILLQRKEVQDRESATRRIVYYVQDAVTIEILGPVNSASSAGASGLLLPPFGRNSANQFVADRLKLFEFQQDIRRGEYRNPPMPHPAPFRLRVDERCIQKAQALTPDDVIPSWDDRRQLSRTSIGEWYAGRERVTDVSVAGAKVTAAGRTRASAFATRCERGVSADGRPYVAVTYTRRFPVVSEPGTILPRTEMADSIRKALDFRVQAQFFICHLVADERTPVKAADFKVRVKQQVTRVEHLQHSPDTFTEFQSPTVGMETTLKVDLATLDWEKAKGLKPLPTIELQK